MSAARSVTAVVLADGVRARLLAWSRALAPIEACGFVLGAPPDGASRVRIDEVVEGRNVAADPRAEFALDPGEYVAVARRAEREGLEVVGVWHAHVGREATPSSRDASPGCGFAVWLIVASPEVTPAAGRADGPGGTLRAWRPIAGGFLELAVADQPSCSAAGAAHNLAPRSRSLGPAHDPRS